MKQKIIDQMLSLLEAGDRNALEVEAALNVLDKLGYRFDAPPVPFAPIPEPAQAQEPPKTVTLPMLRGKIVDARENKGITPADFLGKHGYAKLSDVPETAYAELYAELEAL